MIEDPVQPLEPEKKSNPQLVWWLAGGGCAILLCAAFFVGALLWMRPRLTNVIIPTQVVVPESSPRPQASGNTMGDPNAPVRIVEYGDFQCPYCRRFWQQTEPQLIETYISTGQVYFEYRSVGTFIGPESAAAAAAAYCAGDQGKFWEYHDTLYSNQTGENVGDFASSRLKQFAAALGLDQETFDSCLDNQTYAARVQQDADDAQADGIHATPSFLINGTLVEGAQPFEAFQQEIEAALQGQ
jgi:protein-disulfide isomerase